MMQWANIDARVEGILVSAQTTDDATADPLIAQGSEDVIYVGILLLVIVVTIAAGVLSGQLKRAILLALFLSAILIAIIVAV